MQHQLIGHDAVKSPVTFREMRKLDLRPGQLHQNDNDIVVDPMK